MEYLVSFIDCTRDELEMTYISDLLPEELLALTVAMNQGVECDAIDCPRIRVLSDIARERAENVIDAIKSVECRQAEGGGK